MQILAVALEERMLGYMQHNVNVAGGTAVESRIAMPGVENAGSVLNARGHLHLQRMGSVQQALALARGARILNHGARALADRAGAGYAEESLLVTHLAVAVALAALAGQFAAGRAGTMAGVAQLVAPDVDLLFHAKGRVLKCNGEVFADVGATLRPAAPSAASPRVAEQIAKAEHLPEQVAEVHLLETTLSLSAAVGEGFMAKAVVGGALLLVAKHGVGLAALLEALLGFMVAGVAVRVKLQRQLAICALDLGIARRCG